MQCVFRLGHLDKDDTVTKTNEDITLFDGDVLVNSANPYLGGIGDQLPELVGGIDGVIHRAAVHLQNGRVMDQPVHRGQRHGRLCKHISPL